jgi:3' terminal RNA ribose 2'-O-methyltransferase Hen1
VAVIADFCFLTIGSFMLLTLTCQGQEAPEFSYLLYKNPYRVNQFSLSFGQAVVFYPEFTPDKVSCSLLLNIDPLVLSKDKGRQFGLFDYISDRPYASTSFMSVAISRVFSSALGGRCQEKPELVDKELDLMAEIICLPCQPELNLEMFFVPLGYEVSVDRRKPDQAFEKLGENPYVNLTIRGRVTISEMLRHLYILIPIFGGRKHYFVDRDEVEKLLRLGGEWLKSHPYREQITYLYLARFKKLTRLALDRIEDGEAGAIEDDGEYSGFASRFFRGEPLSKVRLEFILQELRLSGARSVLDLGCGEGRLLLRLAHDDRFDRIVGLDISLTALKKAEERLFKAYKGRPQGLELIQGALTYADGRLKGFDAAVCQEVLEHLDAWRMPIFEKVLFGFLKPKTIIVTTPNVDYNVNYPGLTEGQLRHQDHRFEWNRAQFTQWASSVAEKNGYTVRVSDLGELDQKSGRPTQFGVFTICA